MEPKIVTTNQICLFCGKEIPRRYAEYQEYYECECDDAKEDRRIWAEIIELERSRPKHRYTITTELVLHNVEDDD